MAKHPNFLPCWFSKVVFFGLVPAVCSGGAVVVLYVGVILCEVTQSVNSSVLLNNMVSPGIFQDTYCTRLW